MSFVSFDSHMRFGSSEEWYQRQWKTYAPIIRAFFDPDIGGAEPTSRIDIASELGARVEAIDYVLDTLVGLGELKYSARLGHFEAV